MNRDIDITTITQAVIIISFVANGTPIVTCSPYNSLEFDSPVNQATCEVGALKDRHGPSFGLVSVVVLGIK